MTYKELPPFLVEKAQSLIFFDLETESGEDVSLTAVGAGRYFSDPSTRITLACWKRLGDEEVSYEENPQIPRLRREIKEGDFLVAHNSTFDLTGIDASPDFKGTFGCTFAMCSALNIKGKLEEAGAIINKVHFKTKMPEFMDPKASKQIIDSMIPLSDKERQMALDYCKKDVLALEELFCRLSHQITKDEFDAIDAHLRCNIRGIPFNRHRLVKEAEERRDEVRGIVDAFIGKHGFSPLQTAKVRSWLNHQNPGLELAAVTEKDLQGAYDKVDEGSKEVIDARLSAAKSTTTKLHKVIQRLDYGDEPVGWLKGAFAFGIATTGRFASRGANMQNNKKGGLIKELVVAPENTRIYVGDFAQVELRLALWLTGEQEALHKLHYKEDFYKEVAGQIFNKKPEDINSKERFFGKQLVLGANYGMGSPRFKETCRNAGNDLTDDEAQEMIEGYRHQLRGLSSSWKTLSVAVEEAVSAPNQKVVPRGVRGVWYYYDKPNEELMLKLPTKRIMHYGGIKRIYNKHRRQQVLSYYDPGDRRRKEFTHGGLLLENICQAIGRDLLCRALVRFEKFLDQPHEGVIAHVHDEVVALMDPERDQGDLDDLLVPPEFREGDGVKGLLLDKDSHVVWNWGAAK